MSIHFIIQGGTAMNSKPIPAISFARNDFFFKSNVIARFKIEVDELEQQATSSAAHQVVKEVRDLISDYAARMVKNDYSEKFIREKISDLKRLVIYKN